MTTRPERFRVKALECYVAAQKAKDKAFSFAKESDQDWIFGKTAQILYPRLAK
jgi:hypothetical protein